VKVNGEMEPFFYGEPSHVIPDRPPNQQHAMVIVNRGMKCEGAVWVFALSGAGEDDPITEDGAAN
jgi:hypothetical protein